MTDSTLNFSHPYFREPSISELLRASGDMHVREIVQELLEEDLMRMWNNDDSSLTNNQKLYVHLHKRLKYPTDKDMK